MCILKWLCRVWALTQSINQPTNQSVNHSIWVWALTQSIDQSIIQSTNQSISQSFNLSMSFNSINRSINHSINHLYNCEISAISLKYRNFSPFVQNNYDNVCVLIPSSILNLIHNFLITFMMIDQLQQHHAWKWLWEGWGCHIDKITACAGLLAFDQWPRSKMPYA